MDPEFTATMLAVTQAQRNAALDGAAFAAAQAMAERDARIADLEQQLADAHETIAELDSKLEAASGDN